MTPTLQFYENLEVLPMGNVRHFRRIHKKYGPFPKKVCFSLNSAEFVCFLQVLPMGNVRHFRRIHKNGAPLLKTGVFFAEFTESQLFSPRFNDFREKLLVSQVLPKNGTMASSQNVT